MRASEKNHEMLLRRSFLGLVATAGAGLVVGCAESPTPPPKTTSKVQKPAEPTATPLATSPFIPDAWIRVAPDGAVTVVIDKAEMGQGIETGLAMLVAEELEVNVGSIKTEWAPYDPPKYKNKLFGMQATGGSTSVRGDYVAMRKAAAAARMMLIGAAAEKLAVPAEELEAQEGQVKHAKSGKSAFYGELVDLAKKQSVPQDPPLKDAKSLDVLGTRPMRLDAIAKGAGKAKFGIDVQIPGALIAVVLRCPVPGGKVAKFDASKALAMKGVKKVEKISTGIMVAADNTWTAKEAAKTVEVTWDEGPNAKLSSEGLLEEAKKLVKKPGTIAKNEGDFDAAWKKAKKKVEIAYELPFQAHATMEPLACTAHLKADSCEIWVGHQAVEWIVKAIAGTTGLDPAKITVHTQYLGGGFGRRAEVDFVLEAVECSKAAGTPIKVVWTREDDLRNDFYRPASYIAAQAALGPDGMPTGIRYQAVCASIAARAMPAMMQNGIDHSAIEGLAEQYSFPNARVEWHRQDSMPVGFWRSVGHSTNAFAEECLLDELANLAKIDPIEYRKKLTTDDRLKNVLTIVAEKSNWGKPLEKGKGRGVAAHHSFGTYVAQVAEVSINEKGELKLERVICAVDCGAHIHPGLVEQQMESGILFGATATIKSAIKIENGRAKQSNLHNFKLLQIDETPTIEIHIIQNTEKPGGCGEPGTPPIAPAITNAIANATGKHLHHLPITKADLKK